jgi:hypothetical protein
VGKPVPVIRPMSDSRWPPSSQGRRDVFVAHELLLTVATGSSPRNEIPPTPIACCQVAHNFQRICAPMKPETTRLPPSMKWKAVTLSSRIASKTKPCWTVSATPYEGLNVTFLRIAAQSAWRWASNEPGLTISNPIKIKHTVGSINIRVAPDSSTSAWGSMRANRSQCFGGIGRVITRWHHDS